MRDLGIDHPAGRFLKNFCSQEPLQRKIKLRSLRLPSLGNRLRLYKGGIQSVAMWGVEVQGLAPRYRTSIGHHRGGLLNVIYDLHAKRYQDRGDQNQLNNTFNANNIRSTRSKALWRPSSHTCGSGNGSSTNPTCHRDLQDYGPDMVIGLTDPSWKIEATLRQQPAHQRLRRL